MNFGSESEFKYWLQINGYSKDDIAELSYKWDSVTIINGQITDSVTQVSENSVNDQITDSVTTTDI